MPGRLPHLDGFASGGCAREPRSCCRASNLWFPASQSVIVMPRLDPVEQQGDDADRILAVLGADLLGQYAVAPVALLRHALAQEGIDAEAWSDEPFAHLSSWPWLRRDPRRPGCAPRGLDRSTCSSRSGATCNGIRSVSGTPTNTAA